VLALLVVPAITFIRALEHHEAVAFGFVFVFLFSLAAYYYYLILCVPLLFFASDLGKPQHALGAAFMFLTGLAGYGLFSGWQPLRGFVGADAWLAPDLPNLLLSQLPHCGQRGPDDRHRGDQGACTGTWRVEVFFAQRPIELAAGRTDGRWYGSDSSVADLAWVC
jgi:hypothetical protein